MARWPVFLVVPVVVLTLLTAPAQGAEEVSSQASTAALGGRPSDAKGTNITGALQDSIRLLMIDHAVRVATQEKTRQGAASGFVWLRGLPMEMCPFR